ncbi:MAG: SDR family NAD(P)-dependent oxidoreductase, partial [Oscillospiraceae bacterium]|nr:SDR family NAD(P)-dependent oxidoreductase [Oscillospiraceae bacterium]
MSSGKKVAVVTGGSSGIGLETAKKLLKDGYAVYELSRREPGAGGGIIHVTADVTSDADLAAAAEK